jgi:hypothetical protein
MEAAAPQVSARVLYLARYKVLLCRQCKLILSRGEGVKRHLMRYHKNYSIAVRREIAAYASKLDLIVSDQIVPPTVEDPPISELILYDGWKCDDCHYLCSSERMIKEHCREKHGWRKTDGQPWHSAKVQTFFQACQKRFFEVSSRLPSSSEPQQQQTETGFDTLVTQLLEEGERLDKKEDGQATNIEEGQLPVDNTPWMRKTRWARKFAGYDLCKIASLGQQPSRNDRSLKLASDSVGRVLARCKAGIAQWSDEEEDGDLVLSWLNSPQRDTFNPQPFSIFYAASTHEKYTSYWKRFVCYCLRLVRATDRYGHKLAGHEETALNEIWCVLELELEDENDVVVLLDAKIFRLSVGFWMHVNTASSRSAIVHFSAVLGIDGKRGCYRQPSEYGQVLAGLLYCARLLLFEHALPQGPTGEAFPDSPLAAAASPAPVGVGGSRKDTENPLEMFLAVRDRWLVDGLATPFHFVDNLLAYARGAGKDVGGRSRVQWSKDRQTIIFDGQSLALDDFRRFLAELCDEAGRILADDLLFLPDAREMKEIRLDGLVDDVNESTVGYSFITEPANKLGDRRRRMLERLKASPR